MKFKHFILSLFMFISLLLLIKNFSLGPSFSGLNSSGETLTAIMFLVIGFWVFSDIPLHITGMLGVSFAVILGVVSFNEAFSFFAHPLVFLFMGGFFFSKAIEKTKLDQQIANLILTLPLIEARPRRIFLSLILLTGIFSFWLSNTATVAVFLPITLSLIKEMNFLSKKQIAIILIALAYSATIGGIISPVGTSVNIMAISFLKDLADIQLNFFSWIKETFFFTNISMFILLISVYFILRNLPKTFKIQSTQKHSWTSDQKIVLFLIFLTLFTWVTTSLLETFLAKNSLTLLFKQRLPNSLVIFFNSLILFIIPGKHQGTLLSWKEGKDIEYGTLFLFGSGLALGQMMSSTGLASFMAHSIFDQFASNGFILTTSVIIFTLFLTEFLSNAVTANLILPIAIITAQNFHLNTTAIAIATTIASSLCFLFPVGTPPNAMVYSSGLLSKEQMFSFGLYIKIILFILLEIYVFF